MLVAIAAMLPTTMRAYDFIEGGIYYLVNEDQATVSVTGENEDWTQGPGSYSGDVMIPSTVTHDGVTYTVNAVGNGAFDKCDLTSITLPETIISIGRDAFFACTLSAIDLPQSLVSIGDFAFASSSLIEVIVPDNVTNFGYGVFAMCDMLKSVTLGTSIDNNTLMYYEFWQSDHLESVTCRSAKPPYMGIGRDSSASGIVFIYNFSDTVYENATLYVPRDAVSAYQTASQWQDFQHIEPIGADPCDVNEDGVVNIADANSVIEVIINGGNKGGHARTPVDGTLIFGDMNGDNHVNISDLNLIIGRILDN
mgnify:CR=1 FL=1